MGSFHEDSLLVLDRPGLVLMTGRTTSETSFRDATDFEFDYRQEKEATMETGELVEMLKTLLAEKLRRKRQQQAEETARRDTEMAWQMDLLHGLVEGTRSEGGGDGRMTKDPKVAKLLNSDDIEAYLVTFERLMAAYKVPTSRWAFLLAPQLSEKA